MVNSEPESGSKAFPRRNDFEVHGARSKTDNSIMFWFHFKRLIIIMLHTLIHAIHSLIQAEIPK